MSDYIQLIYASRPFGFDDAMLNGILMEARRNNPRDDITGALICRHDLYLQLLEGPKDAVEAAFERIARDRRHLEVRQCFTSPMAERLFPDWAMRDDPVQSWMWTPQEVAEGAIEKASHLDLLRVFARLAAETA